MLQSMRIGESVTTRMSARRWGERTTMNGRYGCADRVMITWEATGVAEDRMP